MGIAALLAMAADLPDTASATHTRRCTSKARTARTLAPVLAAPRIRGRAITCALCGKGGGTLVNNNGDKTVKVHKRKGDCY